MHSVGMFSIYEYIERAIKVDREFFRDRQYVIRDGEIVIVDEFTGRMAEGRKSRAGIHQAIEAAEEGVEVSVESGQAARITVQDFFHLYPNLCGMTGTASSSTRELKKIYKLRVIPVPTNRPAIREPLAGTGVRLQRSQMASHCRRSDRGALDGTAGADRHAVDR